MTKNYDDLADIGTPAEIAAALEEAMPGDLRRDGYGMARDYWLSAGATTVQQLRGIVEAWRARNDPSRAGGGDGSGAPTSGKYDHRTREEFEAATDRELRGIVEAWRARSGHANVPPGADPALVRRPRGRSPWTVAEFQRRFREAQAATSPPWTPARIAANFMLLDGTIGTSSDRVAAIRRKLTAE